jgi:hypothetical protein
VLAQHRRHSFAPLAMFLEKSRHFVQRWMERPSPILRDLGENLLDFRGPSQSEKQARQSDYRRNLAGEEIEQHFPRNRRIDLPQMRVDLFPVE